MAITLAGLASGIDAQALIAQLVQVERQPINAIEQQQSAVTAASQTLATFSSKLGTLRSAALALSTASGFASYSAKSNDAAIVASAGEGASVGSYDIRVDALAKEQRNYGTAMASATDALGMSGRLSVSVGSGAAVDVDVVAGDSLAAIAGKLSSSGARIGASVLFDGTNYRLQVRGLDTGAANAFSIAETGTSLGLATPTSTVQTAADAQLTIDGLSVTRPTNQISGVVPGVTLALTRTTTTPVRVDVATDSSALSTKIKAFVTAYNDVMSSGHVIAGYGQQKAASSVLANDRAIRSSLDRIAGVVSQEVAGTTGRYTTLGSVGISTKRDGTMALDESVLARAFAEDPTAVARIFTTDSSIGATGSMKSFATIVDDLTNVGTGVVQNRLEALGSQNRRLGDTKDAMERRLAAYQQNLQKQFTALDTTSSRYNTLLSYVTNALGGSSSSDK